jgi:hypothetical protein
MHFSEVGLFSVFIHFTREGKTLTSGFTTNVLLTTLKQDGERGHCEFFFFCTYARHKSNALQDRPTKIYVDNAVLSAVIYLTITYVI